jgi:hypothetical protein
MSDYDTLRQMAIDVANGDNNSAHDKFNSIIASRVADALDTRKQEIAQSLYVSPQEDADA